MYSCRTSIHSLCHLPLAGVYLNCFICTLAHFLSSLRIIACSIIELKHLLIFYAWPWALNSAYFYLIIYNALLHRKAIAPQFI